MSATAPDVLIGSQSDERLVALARAGHGPAFVAIVERYRHELAAQARRLDSSGRAEDIVQQTFLSAFEALRAGAEVRHLRGWLYQILRHAAIRSASTERPEVELDSSLGATSSLEETVEKRILARDLLSGLTRLPARQREAIVAASIAGSSRAEVSRSMGITEGAVRQLVHRARATLRTAVTALIPYPLANFLTTSPADGAAEVAIGAGAVSAGGAVIKLGALIASGVFATAVVASLPTDHDPKHPLTSGRGSVVVTSHAYHDNALVILPGNGARSGGGHTELGRSSSTTARSVGSSDHRGHHSAVARAPGSSRGRDASSGASTGDGNGNGSHGGSGSDTTSGSGSPGGTGGGGGDGSPGGPGPNGSGSAGSGHSGGSSGDSGGQALAGGNGQQVATEGGGSGASGGPSASGSGSDGGAVSGGGSGSAGGLTPSGGRSSDTTGSSGDSSSHGGTVSSGGGSGSSSGLTTDHGGTSGG